MVVVCGAMVHAADGARDWQPAEPMPESFDWIQMNSGEWLKGEFIAMYKDSLEFDSDELDLLTLDWVDVRRVRSARPMQVRFLGGVTGIGKMDMDGDVVHLIGDEGGEFSRADIVSIIGGAPRERNYWAAKISFGFNVRSGNTEQVEANSQAKIQRRTPVNRIVFDAIGNFGETDNVKTVDNLRAGASWDIFLTDRFFVIPVFVEYFRDPFKNISLGATVGAGVGWQLIDTSRIDWSVSFGPAYQETRFEEVEVGSSEKESTPSFRTGTVLDIEITKSIDFGFDYSFFLTSEAAGTYNHHLVTGLEFEITRVIDFDVTGVWDRIQDPRPDADGVIPEQDDYRMIVALGFEF
jgi:putative salt-induced outer membrane protein YdiY